jgi:ABC-type glycerol-3-phosphate transport system permease component
MAVRRGRRAPRARLLYGGLTLLSLLWLVPVAGVLVTSVRPLSEVRSGWWHLAGATFTLRNYGAAWRQGLSGYVANSFVIACASVLLTVAAGVLAAYALARLSFRGRKTTYFLLVTTMIVPVQIILIPLLPWFRTLGLNQGRWQFLGISLVHTAFGAGLAVFMLTPFLAEIPREIVDAARVDGAGHAHVFRRVILPLAVPALVSFAIVDFVFVWNDLLLALTLLGRGAQPLTVGLANLQSPHLAQEDVVSAGSIMAILPPLLLFVGLNRLYVRGLFAGSVKS